MVIWSSQDMYREIGYSSEADLESAILLVQSELFGSKRIYLDVKKKIGAGGGPRNIPDGYLIDLFGKHPRLYVVEVELAAHEPLRHIAVQILKFALSFESQPRAVKDILFNALERNSLAKDECEQYAAEHGYRNLDHLLESTVYESPFAALVIIDQLADDLENVLAKKFQFGVEVLELVRYESAQGERMYSFEPFLADVEADVEAGKKRPGKPLVDTEGIDTIVVPAREEGFEKAFIGENRWYAIRIHGTMRPQIKYIAAYRVAPVSAITHVATVKSIEPWKDTGKFVVDFAEPAEEIGPIMLGEKKAKGKAPQAPRYTSMERLQSAKTLDDIW